MHRHRQGFNQIKLAYDLGAELSDSTTTASSAVRSSLSSSLLSSFGGGGGVGGDDIQHALSFEEAFGNQGRFARRPSRFLEATFRDSTGTKDDMAIPSNSLRRSREYRPAFPPSTSPSATTATAAAAVTVSNYNDTPFAATTISKPSLQRVFSTDDSVVGNFVRPKIRPHPSDTKLRSDLESPKNDQTLENTLLTTRNDLSGSLVTKLRSIAIQKSHNKAVGRRRASVTVLTGSQGSEDDHYTDHHHHQQQQQRHGTTDARGTSRSRSRTPIRRGRSHSLGAKLGIRERKLKQSSPQDPQRRVRHHGYKEKEDTLAKRREQQNHHRHHHRQQNKRSTDDQGDSRSHLHTSNHGSRRHQRTADDSSRRNHRTDDSSRWHERSDNSSRRNHKSQSPAEDDSSRLHRSRDDNDGRRHHRIEHRRRNSQSPEASSSNNNFKRRHSESPGQHRRAKRSGSGSPRNNQHVHRRRGSASPPDGQHRRMRADNDGRGTADPPGEHEASERRRARESRSPTEDGVHHRRRRSGEHTNLTDRKSRSPRNGNRRRHSESPGAKGSSNKQTEAKNTSTPVTPRRRQRGSLIIPGQYPVPAVHKEEKSTETKMQHEERHREETHGHESHKDRHGNNHHHRSPNSDRKIRARHGEKDRRKGRPNHRRLERKRSLSTGDLTGGGDHDDDDKTRGKAKHRSSSADRLDPRHRRRKSRSHHSHASSSALNSNNNKDRHEAVSALAAGRKVTLSPRSRRLSVQMNATGGAKESIPRGDRRHSTSNLNSSSSGSLQQNDQVRPRGRSPLRHKSEESAIASIDSAERTVHKLTLDTGRRRSISPKLMRTMATQSTGLVSSNSSKFKDELLRQESQEDSEELFVPAERPAVTRHSSLSRLETKSRKSLYSKNSSYSELGDHAGVAMERSRMGFLDERTSFTDSERTQDIPSTRGLLVKSILRSDDDTSSDEVEDVSPNFTEARFSDPSFSEVEFDVTETITPSLHRVTTTNLDHVDLTALSASQVKVVLERARGEQ